MSEIELRLWLVELINKCREKSSKFSNKEKPRLIFIENFESPLQIIAFWFQNIISNIDLQIFFFTHSDKFEDLYIELSPPIQFSDSANRVSEILTKDIFDEIHPDYMRERHIKYSKYIENAICNAFGNFKNSLQNLLYRTNEVPFLLSSSYSSQSPGSIWTIYGNVLNMTVESMLEKIFKKSKSDKNRTKVKKIKNIKQGYGSHIFPPIWLGLNPKLTLEDKLMGTRFQNFLGENSCFIFKNRLIIVETDGFIAIEEQDKKLALKLLNEVMAMAYLLGFDFHLIRNMDLWDLKMNLDKQTIVSLQISGKTKRTEIYDERWKDLSEFYLLSRDQISSEDFKIIIRNAENIIINDEISTILNLLLGAFTHYCNNEFSMSFIMCWSLIEKIIISLYKESINKVVKDSRQIKKLEKKKFRMIDDKIEVLSLMETISSYDYFQYLKFKKIRNRIIHEGEETTDQAVRELLDFSKILINTSLKIER